MQRKTRRHSDPSADGRGISYHSSLKKVRGMRSLHALRLVGMTILAILILPNPVFAHVLKTDGSIGAVMHVNPEDEPVAGQESSFFFEFKDKKNTFKPEECDCHFVILQNGKELFTQPLFQNNSDPSLANASVNYTFPERGVYTIKVIGKPYANTFEPFTLEYDIRVERTLSETASVQSDNWFIMRLPILTGGLIGFSILGFVLFKNRRKK